MDFYDSICKALQCPICGRNMMIKGRKVMKTLFDRQLCSDCINNYPEFSDAVEDKVYTIVLQQYMKLLDIVTTDERQVMTLPAAEAQNLVARVHTLEEQVERFRSQVVLNSSTEYVEPKYDYCETMPDAISECIKNMDDDVIGFFKQLDAILYIRINSWQLLKRLLEAVGAKVSYKDEWKEPTPGDERIRIIFSEFLKTAEANEIAEQYDAPVVLSDYVLILAEAGQLRCMQAAMLSDYNILQLFRMGFPYRVVTCGEDDLAACHDVD